MKDAYSFDLDEKGLDIHYQKMRRAYRRIFHRLGLVTMDVEADVGAMGGSASEEFMVLSEVGEETIIHCRNCGYRANVEQAESRVRLPDPSIPVSDTREEVHTPGIISIEDLSSFFSMPSDCFLKCVVYKIEGDITPVFLRGDREVNDIKAARFFSKAVVEKATEDEIRTHLRCEPGYIGPMDLPSDVRAVYDVSVQSRGHYICGGGKKDTHIRWVRAGVDFDVPEYHNLSAAASGDICLHCGETLQAGKGIELGHIFKLGRKYTESIGVRLQAEDGKDCIPIMGCYGIGVTRAIAAIIEQNHDENGMIWPISVAPYMVGLVSLARSDEEHRIADRIYDMLMGQGWEVLYDDRRLSAGVKFNDMDLIGLPIRVLVGKKTFSENLIEIKDRRSRQAETVPVEQLFDRLEKIRDGLMGSLDPDKGRSPG